MKTSLIAVAAMLAAGCSGTEPGPLKVTMSLDRPAVQMDDSLLVTLTVVNTSAEPAMVYPAAAYGPCRIQGFDVYDRDGHAAYESYICLAMVNILFIPEPVQLAAGQTMEITRIWRPSETYIAGERIPPGSYYIRGAVATPDREFHTPLREVIVGG